MRISDWSSDVCSSDLVGGPARGLQSAGICTVVQRLELQLRSDRDVEADVRHPALCDLCQDVQIGGDQPEWRAERRRWQSAARRRDDQTRSEEHTSELQSLMRISYAVFCLKKKKHTIPSQLHT